MSKSSREKQKFRRETKVEKNIYSISAEPLKVTDDMIMFETSNKAEDFHIYMMYK